MLDIASIFVAFALVAVPICFGWVLADCSHRNVIRVPRPIIAAVNALYMSLVAAPIAFVALFALLVGRAWLIAGHAPTMGHFGERMFEWVDTSPHPLDMPIHAWTAAVLLLASHAAVVLLVAVWPILRVERGESLRKITRVFVPGYALVWAVILTQPFYFDEWFVGSMLR